MKYSLIFLLLTTTLAGCSFFRKHPTELQAVEHTIEEVLEVAEAVAAPK